MNIEKIYRHGDVIIFRLAPTEQPFENIPTKTVNKLTLALGEVTGHSHILEGEIEVAENENLKNSDLYFQIQNRALLSHQEHDTIVLEKGIYLKVNQVEYDPFTEITRYVMD
jgi:hypothetical protein